LARRGFVFLGVVVGLIGLVIAQFTGGLAAGVSVRTVQHASGDALVAGSDVKMRGVVVGRVSGVHRQLGKPGAVIDLLIAPGRAATVPAGVTARILPANVFGQDFVELLPPAAGGPGIRSGARIPEDRSAATLELSDVFAKLYRVLTAVQPAKLASALGALAEALNGRGEQINSIIGRSDSYLRQLAPQLPAVDHDITAFAQFAATVARQTPQLLDSVDDVLVLLRTLLTRQAQFVELLGGGLGLTGHAKDLLSNNEKNLIQVAHQSREIFGAFGAHPDAFSKGFIDLGAFLGGLTVYQGRGLGFDAKIDGAPLPSYGPADCPRYPGLAGPKCVGGSAPAGAAVGAAAGDEIGASYGGIGPIGSVGEKLALSAVLSQLVGEAGAAFGDVGMLLAGSVFRGTTVLLPDDAR
jgi:phospholipid/cholesterol/gamma-HCH transport system substrate-binding protein